MTDLSLLAAAQAGDSGAIERLLVEYQPTLRRYAQRSCFISDVDEAVQESLLVLSRQVASLRHVRALSSWLFQIVRRECHRFARVSLRRDLFGDDVTDRYVESRSLDELRLDVVAAVQSLPEHYRTVLILRDVEGLTISEMAKRLKTTVAAVKAVLHRARALTREYLVTER